FGQGIAVDANGNAYITGMTDSQDFPTANAYQSSLAGNGSSPDAFVAKLGTSGGLSYSTYLGGPANESGNGIAVDSSASAYVTGVTGSGSQFPKHSPFQNNAGGGGLDAFVTKFDPSGSSLVYSSGLGGGDLELGNAIAVDASGNAYVCGEVFSLDGFSSSFPLVNPLQAVYGGGDIDAFVAKINPGGSTVVFATLLGGEDNDSALGIALDPNNNVYVTGRTRSAAFPTTLNAFQPAIGGGEFFFGTSDAFVTKIASSGTSLSYSSYLGGSLDETGEAIAVDNSGEI